MNTKTPKTQIRVFWLLKEEPFLESSDIAKKLGISIHAVDNALSRIGKRRKTVSPVSPVSLISKSCKHCFKATLKQEGNVMVCHNCGAESPLEYENTEYHESQPVNAMLWGHGLGGAPDYNALREGSVKTRVIQSHPRIIFDEMTKVLEKDPIILTAKAELARFMKAQGINSQSLTDQLGTLLQKEIAKFKQRYPFLKINYKIRRQLCATVLKEAQIAYRNLKQTSEQYIAQYLRS